MISFIILLRLRQTYRYLQELGWLRSLVLILAIMIFLPRFAVELWMNNPYYLVAFWGFVLLNIHLQRADHTFLQSMVPQYTRLYTIEYSVLSGAFIGLFIQQQYWWGAVVLLAEVILLPYMPRFSGLLGRKNQYWWETKRLLSPLHFEWTAGIRQRFVYLCFIWFLGLFFCWYAPVAPVLSLLLGMTIPSFYILCEPKEMVEVLAKSAREFVWWKVKQVLKLFATFTAPLWIIFLVFNPHLWFVVPTVGLIVGLWLVLAVLAKYAAYDPGEQLTQNNTLMGLAIMFTFLPPFSFLINVFWVVRYYRRAVSHMENYLIA
ncbi:MAG TPA: hypothetical protein DCS93_41620 [Microscillaceae bacterium]|nr:hypothetical protein [Microscillaceae bacterium]